MSAATTHKPKRDRYLLALNALVATMSVSHFTQIDPLRFCLDHDVHPDFIARLTEMGFLIADDSGNYPAIKITKSLHSVLPEHAIAWVERGESKEVVVEVGQKEVKLEGDQVAAFKPLSFIGPAQIIREPIQRESQIVFTPKNSAPSKPYNIDIEADGLRLNMNVVTSHDAHILNAVLAKLNS